jgi:DNA polymerase I-like protein with 3'-5' exonuclease and polymerase domains
VLSSFKEKPENRIVKDVTKMVYPGPGELVLAMGSEPLDLLKKQGIVQKNRTITACRGFPFKCVEGGHWMITYNPNAMWSDAAKPGEIGWDTRLALRFLETGSTKPPLGDYEWADDLSGVVSYVEWKFAQTGQKVVVSLDLETMGFHPYYPNKHIVTIQMSVEEGHSDVVYMLGRTKEEIETIVFQLRWLLTSKKVSICGANLKFDLIWIFVKYQISCTNFDEDTLLIGSLLDENRYNSLNMHCKLFTPIGGYDDEFNSKHDKGHMELIKKDDLLPYAGGDTDGALRVRNVFYKELDLAPGIRRFYNKLLHPAARAFEKIEARGVVVDHQAYEVLRAEVTNYIADLETKMVALLPGRLRAKHITEIENKLLAGKNPFTAALITDLFFTPDGFNLKPKMQTEKSEKASTSYDHLIMFKDHDVAGKFVALLDDATGARKTLNTYITGFLEHLRPDGRFHPTYALYRGGLFEGDGDDAGTVTGRTSAKNPAMQCMVGETLVTTSLGLRRLDWLVEHNGAGLKVLTHTGQWREIVGVFYNGVKPVFQIEFETGHKIVCTGNHPVMTSDGWVRTDQLKLGTIGYVIGAQDQELYQPHVLLVGGDEEPLPERDFQGLGELWGSRYKSLRPLAKIREFLGRYGGEAWRGVVHRAGECGRALRAWELCLGQAQAAGRQSSQYSASYVQWADQDNGGLGTRVWDFSWLSALSPIEGHDPRGGINDENAPVWGAFQSSKIIGIIPLGSRETFDLTIDRSHSFVADGVVVHNTIPKHTKWAKKLRKCFPAPPGMVVFECDFAQGELKVTACVAGEQKMIHAYLNGIDLHALTGAKLAGLDFEAFLKLKETDPATFSKYRSSAKPANFGLLYGMGAEGYREYARISYNQILTLEEAETHRNAFFDLYPGLIDWHEEYRLHAHQFELVSSPLGRVRHLPLIKSKIRSEMAKAERQAINSPIQSCLSDMCLWSIALHDAAHPEANPETQIVGMTHDAIYGYAPEKNAVNCVQEMVEIMSNLPLSEFDWHPELQFTADANIGPTLGELKEIKF